jgi:periplasmic glucans biosynthesis protein
VVRSINKFATAVALRGLGFAVLVGGCLPALSQETPMSADDHIFSVEHVRRLAADLARKPFEPPRTDSFKWLAKLDYDRYRDIRFRTENALWRGDGRFFQLQPLPMGWLFQAPVTINIVDKGLSKPLLPNPSLFEFGKLAGSLPEGEGFGYSGFRVSSPINRPSIFDEIVVFQGASYFRAVSRGQSYGLSARGLAVNTGGPTGEEFPLFREFWIETPEKTARQLVVHALLDSPSTTGAYTFQISSGAPTDIFVEMTLFPRQELDQVGIAPLTSMYLFSSFDRSRVNDFRPAVHDSDGLAIWNGNQERIWRPLTNPLRLQASAFQVRDPKGFGLIQRHRKLADYQDLEAQYERRPSAWVVPVGAWGQGSINLLEIPTDSEIHDNIVAYWRPAAPLAAGHNYSFAYHLRWSDDVPVSWHGAIAASSWSGLANGLERKNGTIQYAIDFKGPAVGRQNDLPEAVLSASAGEVSGPTVQFNPDTKGARVSFRLTPKEAELVELRLELRRKGALVSEVWLSRWNKQ